MKRCADKFGFGRLLTDLLYPRRCAICDEVLPMGEGLICRGHTHRRDLTCYKDSYIVNPGSLALPRDNRIGTYMLLDFDQHGTPFFAQNELPRVESNVSSFRRKFDM